MPSSVRLGKEEATREARVEGAVAAGGMAAEVAAPEVAGSGMAAAAPVATWAAEALPVGLAWVAVGLVPAGVVMQVKATMECRAAAAALHAADAAAALRVSTALA